MTASLTQTERASIMLVAGEPSGDALGAQLMGQLSALTGGQVRLIGVGGREMRARGLQSLFPIDDIAVIGIRDVVPRIPQIWARIRQAAAFAEMQRPAAVVLIDSSDFMRRVAIRIKTRAPDQLVLKYVAPQVWASRPGRAKAMAKYFDHMLCLFPFEVPFFQQAGLPATFVGHPVVERVPKPGLGPQFRAAHGLSADDKLLVVLPGSRMSEVRFLAPIFRETVDQLTRAFPGLKIVVPTVPTVAAHVRAAFGGWNRPVTFIEDSHEKWAAFEAAHAALAASGTVATELALAGTPMVMAYRVGWLTAAVARRMVSVKYFTLLNIVLDRMAIPEHFQEECTPENLAQDLATLLKNPAARATQVTAAGEALKQLGLGGESPSLRAARAVLEISRWDKRRQSWSTSAPTQPARPPLLPRP